MFVNLCWSWRFFVDGFFSLGGLFWRLGLPSFRNRTGHHDNEVRVLHNSDFKIMMFICLFLKKQYIEGDLERVTLIHTGVVSKYSIALPNFEELLLKKFVL
jgi:hypothetical protein